MPVERRAQRLRQQAEPAEHRKRRHEHERVGVAGRRRRPGCGGRLQRTRARSAWPGRRSRRSSGTAGPPEPTAPRRGTGTAGPEPSPRSRRRIASDAPAGAGVQSVGEAPGSASCWVAAPTPAAVESPSTSSRSGSGPASSPSQGRAASGSRGVVRRTRVPCGSTTGTLQHRERPAGARGRRPEGGGRRVTRRSLRARHGRDVTRIRFAHGSSNATVCPSSRASTP